MLTNNRKFLLRFITSIMVMTIPAANAAVGLDRTRLIINGDKKSETLTITNHNKEAPYLAQSWVEDDSGKKLENEFIALPLCNGLNPIQKVKSKYRPWREVHILKTESHFTILMSGKSS